MAYSYDRTAKKSKKSEKTPAIPKDERDDVIKHITSCQWIVKEWGIRTQAHQAENYEGVSPEREKAVKKFEQLLEKLRETAAKL